MPTLILEDHELEYWLDDVDIQVRGRGSDDRYPRATSRPIDEVWYLDEEERRAYFRSLWALLE